MNSNFSAKDFILLLLKQDNLKPIIGNLFFQKEMFLIVEEVYPELKDELQFKAYNYGPYSEVLVTILNEMKDKNLIDFDNSEKNEYKIAQKGLKYINNIKFPTEIETKVKNLKIGSNKLGYKGLLRYVYFSYPEYTVNSKIKEEVLGDN